MFSPDVKDPLFLSEISEGIFRSNGSLVEFLNFEHRPEQEETARFCAQSFECDLPLVSEAGTGVGKSLAYLIPGIIAAKSLRRPLVVSTHTIALQQQILRKDLPLARLLFSRDGVLNKFADFKTACLMGRANYLCTNRLKRAIIDKSELFASAQQSDLERIRDWSLVTQTGLLEELNPLPDMEVWGWVNADSPNCSPKNCPDDTCFYQKARKAVAGADVIIVNHSLLFSLLAAGIADEIGTKGVLFPSDMLVLDEAHLVPDIAAENFGLAVSSGGIARELRRIYDPHKKRGLITREKLATSYDKEAVTAALLANEEFFAELRGRYLTKRDTVALSAPQWCENILDAPLEALIQTLSAIAQRAQTEHLKTELKDYQRRLTATRQALQEAIFLASNDQVYWLEKGAKDSVHINSAPIDVAPILREVLFERDTSVILTSATLSTSNGDLDSFIAKAGAECAEKNVCKSPFDYASHMRVLLYCDAPEPDKDSKKLDCEHLAGVVERLCAAVNGGTLVLFTGYFEMNRTAEILRESELLKGREILVQKQMPRTELIKRFEEKGSAILLGTDSFWTGIDVPGPALSQVIITRLPFANPSHPLTEARYDRLASQGGNPFRQIAIPDAVIKFRQGVGRLIRNKTDRGIISLLDSRLVSKNYGKNFLSALPDAPIMRFKLADLEQVVEIAKSELKI